MLWHIIAGEYPPQAGGVSDYTRMISRGLADADDDVHIWAPPCHEQSPCDVGITVHRLKDHFGLVSLAELHRAISSFPKPHRLLIQYVPHAFGWKAMNVPFCLWLNFRRSDSISTMFHEVVFPLSWKQPLLHNILGTVTRLMAWLTVRASNQVFVSIPAWGNLVRSIYSQPRKIRWLPIPSNIPVVDDAEKISDIRRRYVSSKRFLIGHFGTYGQQISDMLMAILPVIMTKYGDQTVLLLGRGSEAFRDKLLSCAPALGGRVFATGSLSSVELSLHLSASDVLLQPYPDGVSSRRTSVMAGLAHGRPIVTNSGLLTEPLWAESGAVILVPVGDESAMVEATRRLLIAENERRKVGTVARTLYQETFDVRLAIAALRDVAA